MSDEPKPFRLKPRLRPDEPAAVGEAPAASPAPAPVEPAPEVENTTPKLRLKPRLTPEPSAEKESTPAEAPPAPPPPAALPPPPAPKVAAAESASSSERFRLKPRLAPESAASESAASESAASSSNAQDSSLNPAPESIVAEASAGAGESGEAAAEVAPPIPPPRAPGVPPPRQPPPIHLKAPEGNDPALSAEAAPPPKRRKPPRRFLSGALLLIVLGAAGYLGWKNFLAPTPPPAVVRPPLTPSVTLNKIAAAPADLMAKAQAVINDRRENEQDRVDAAVAGKNVPAERAVPTPPPGAPVATPSAPTPTVAPVVKIDREEKQSVIAPGITATTMTVVSSLKASAEFRSFVAAMRINGVFQGSPARALINGRTYREGDIIDPALGIVFERVVADNKQIIFRDQSGATVERSY